MQFGDVHALGGRVSWGHVGHTDIVLSKIEFFTNLVTNLYNLASLKFFLCALRRTIAMLSIGGILYFSWADLIGPTVP